MSDDVARLTRTELYEQVWTTPMRRLAPQYGLSDVGLAKICKKLNIPRPPVGYWAKKEVGKAPARPKLPEADKHGDDLVELPVPGEIEEPQQYEFHDARLAELYESELRRSAPKIPAAVRSEHRIAHQSKRWFTEHAKWEARCKKAGAGMYWPEPPKRPSNALSLDVSDRDPRSRRMLHCGHRESNFGSGLSVPRFL